MKKSVLFICILLVLPFLSAVTIDMKSSYDQGETIIAKISGDFFTSLKEDNIFFYRGHVKIPMDYDLAKIGNYYYVKASTLRKAPNNYSLQIKNAHYYLQGQLIDDIIVKPFAITDNIADFVVNPGFVVSIADFYIELKNLQNIFLPITINAHSSLNFVSSFSLYAGEIKEVDFGTSGMKESLLSIIEISTSNLKYEIPIYIEYFPEPPQEPYCGDGRVDSGEQCDAEDWGPIIGCADFGFNDGTLSCNEPGTVRECMFDLKNCFTSTNIGCFEDNECGENQACIDKKCVNLEPAQQCNNRETKCDGKVYYICEDEFWVSQGKVIGKCSVECLSGEKCVSQEDYICENDQWENKGLIDGKCGYESESGECITDAIKCDFKIYYVCENKRWVSQGQVDGKCGYSEPEPFLEPYCGDGKIDAGEQCDGYRWGMVSTCQYFGFNDGLLNCIDCSFDTSLCFNRDRDYECWYNSDCNLGYKCDDLECIEEEVEACSSLDDCDDEEICFRGSCIKMQECIYNSHCDLGYWCDEGVCVEIEYDCLENIDCGQNKECDEGYCIEKQGKECTYDKDCKGSYECDEGYCIEKPECTKEDLCLTGYECVNTHCTKKQGDECTKAANCQKNHECKEGYCIEIESEDECQTFRECPYSFTCERGNCVNSLSAKNCKELGGEICAQDEICPGTIKDINSAVCCLDALCEEQEPSSLSRIVGWGLIIVVGLAIFYFFIKYQGAKRKNLNLKKLGLKR